MQPNRQDVPFTGHPFDMRQMAAAMPTSNMYPNPQDFYQPMPGYNAAPPVIHPAYAHVQQNDIQSWRRSVANNVGWRAEPGNFSERQGLHGPGWNPSAPRDARMWPLNATAPSSQPQSPRIPVPSSPRGPPRKPKRSGFAIWVGNLPPSTSIEALKDHFSTGATQEIESVFLMWKSNCAFVNYSTERACRNAMSRFHNSRFRGRTLSCRIRRVGSAKVEGSAESSLQDANGISPTSTMEDKPEPKSPVIVAGDQDLPLHEVPETSSPIIEASTKSIPSRYFILKSLTVEDLEASVTTGFWSTQPHNEEILNTAFAEAGDVFLIFSANRSGGYFGYARMTSRISRQAAEGEGVVTTTTYAAADESESDAPRTIATPATGTAPKGRIIDDSARGSIFWEADRDSDSTPVESSQNEDNTLKLQGQFALEWISVTKIPFVHTRGMRNSLNGNREIKIARDGQELDPRVGRILLELFRRVEERDGQGF